MECKQYEERDSASSTLVICRTLLKLRSVFWAHKVFIPWKVHRQGKLTASKGVGKTSLLHRYVKGTFNPPSIASTVGANFLTKRILDVDSGTTVRLQLWDTAGQERFRAISRLYYRGASAVLLVYSIIDEQSFEEMGRWLMEMRENLGEDTLLHIVGAKSDIVAQDPSLRKVPFERCIAYVAENLYSETVTTPPVTASSSNGINSLDGASKRSSAFWGQELGWNCCHEVSASSGEGIEEVFRVITRKLVEQRHTKAAQEHASNNAIVPSPVGVSGSQPDGGGPEGCNGGDKRRSWLGFPTTGVINIREEQLSSSQGLRKPKKGKCC